MPDKGHADVLIWAAAVPRPGQNGAAYQSDANLVVPADDTPLWRYLDFARFMALLDSASLWFARADTFSDQYELAVPAADMAAAVSSIRPGVPQAPPLQAGARSPCRHGMAQLP